MSLHYLVKHEIAICETWKHYFCNFGDVTKVVFVSWNPEWRLTAPITVTPCWHSRYYLQYIAFWWLLCIPARQWHRRACDTIQLLRRETSDFIGPELWPPNSPDLNPVDYKIWELMMEDCVYQTAVHDVDELKQSSGLTWSRAWSTRLLMNFSQGSRLVVMPRDDILNVCFVEHEHYFITCLTCLRNFSNVSKIAKTMLCIPQIALLCFTK